MNETTPLTLLAVLAHPDDETFGMGGMLARYARDGVAVHLVCATHGEAGTVDPELMHGFNSVGELREGELRCAAGLLGLAGVHFLGYRDSGMPGAPDNFRPKALAAQPVEQVAEDILGYIRTLHPQVVVTFDPLGGYKHPDHIAVQRATLLAFQRAGDPAFRPDLPPYQPSKLYYHVFPKKAMKFFVRLMPLLGQNPRRFGRNRDIDLAALVEEGDFPVHARISYRGLEKLRNAATACHASQLPGGAPTRGFFRRVMFMSGPYDTFMRAFPPASPRLREKDLFEGLTNGNQQSAGE